MVNQYVFLVGAAKCGTTSLTEMLSAHPAICVSNPKETDFFTNENHTKGMESYESCFVEKDKPVRIDASVSYSAGWEGSSANIAKRLNTFAPTSKVIYIVRDPLDRTWSAYWHAKRSGYEHKSFIDSVANISVDHVQASMYFQRLTDYLEVYDRSNIIVIHQNQLRDSPQLVVDKILTMLELEPFIAKRSRANESYQLSGVGKFVHDVLPISMVKKISQMARASLPNGVQDKIKKVYTKPIPKMTKAEATYLCDIFSRDADALYREYGVDVKNSVWWKHLDSSS